jgi:KaiC/GvpD/RAD55 family RecA-like ATPase
MRATVLLLSLILFGSVIMWTHVTAQPTEVHTVVLYAHSTGNSMTLTAAPTWVGQKAADISRDLVFRLSPALSENLQIYGGITMTVYLRGSTILLGTVVLAISELRQDGTETPVPGAQIDSPIVLNTQTNLATLGVGIIQYEFKRGSSILLRVRVDQRQAVGVPTLVWDDPATPTNIRIPAVSPVNVDLRFSSDHQFGRILQVDHVTSAANVSILANARDAFGAYRLVDSSLKLTAPNGTIVIAQLKSTNSSGYVHSYLFAARLSSGRWQVNLGLRDVSGDQYSFGDNVWVSQFNTARINLSDSTGNPIASASLTVTFQHEGNWSASTNSTGWAILTLPSSLVIGPLNLTIGWLGVKTPWPLNVIGDSTFLIRLRVCNLTLRVSTDGIPVPFATVKLSQEGTMIGEALAGVYGDVNFRRIPAGNYTILIDYLLAQYQVRVNVNDDRVISVGVPIPHRTTILLAFLAVAGTSTYVWVRRKRTKLYARSFNYFSQLVPGGLPKSCFAVITGNSGSGKSVLLNTLASEQVKTGNCIYITNTEYPETIRRNMRTLGIYGDMGTETTRIKFIDAYSAVGGTHSKEERYVTSHTDLTSLGLEITKCFETAGPGTDVYLDSLTPLANVLRMDYLLNFLQSIAAKIKANDGSLCVTTGAGIEKEDLAKLEEASDCVIETQLQESSRGQRRRLRIKKLRDRHYDDRWVRFEVQAGKGIVFLTSKKPERV